MARLKKRKKKKGRKRRQNKTDLISSLSEEDTGIKYKQFQTGIIKTHSGWRSQSVQIKAPLLT